MGAEICTWRNWTTHVEWLDDVTLAPALKHRLAVFLARVMETLDALARRVDGACDADALAALLPRVGPIPAPWADDLLWAPLEWSTRRADAARVTDLVRDIEALLEWEPEPIAQVVAMLLAERILRAVLANRSEHLEDPDGVLTAANVLEQQVRRVLLCVTTGQVSAAEYRLM